MPPIKQPRAWQRMLSGRRLNLLDPSPLDIEISDIAHGLARVARWNGQTQGEHAYSVAQHSVLVHDVLLALDPTLTPTFRLIALLHDAPEYVIGDMISPFKSVMGGNYKDVEKRLIDAIHIRFSLPTELPNAFAKRLKEADKISAFIEATTLAGFSSEEAAPIFGKPAIHPLSDFSVVPKSTGEAQSDFLALFAALEKDL
ncbi:MAG: HD family hydrolase [Hyphomicrobiales bacterium]